MSSTADMQRVTQCSSQYLVTGVLEHLTSSQATLTMMIITSSSLWPLSWSATSTTLSFTSLSSIAKILSHHTLPLSPCNSRQRRPPRSGRCTPSCSPTLGLGTVRGSGRNWLLLRSSSSRRRRAAAAPRLSDSVESTQAAAAYTTLALTDAEKLWKISATLDDTPKLPLPGARHLVLKKNTQTGLVDTASSQLGQQSTHFTQNSPFSPGTRTGLYSAFDAQTFSPL